MLRLVTTGEALSNDAPSKSQIEVEKQFGQVGAWSQVADTYMRRAFGKLYGSRGRGREEDASFVAVISSAGGVPVHRLRSARGCALASRPGLVNPMR